MVDDGGTAPVVNDTLRALKKYEAEAIDISDGLVATSGDTQTPSQELYSPFGPLIAKATLPLSVISHLNTTIDKAFAAVGKGQQSGEMMLTDTDVSYGGQQSLGFHLAQHIMMYAESVEGQKVKDLSFEAIWTVNQMENAPSPVHFHSSDISGVLYLKTPELDQAQAAEKEANYIGGRRAGYLNFLSGGKQAFNKSLISFKPVVGDVYIFPGWLLHGVEAFAGKGERRSVAFNANVSF